MPRARRTVYLFFHCHDGAVLDVEAMLRGVARLAPRRQLHAISILRGDEVPIESEELETVLEFPSDEWVEVEGTRQAEVEALARKGLLVVDSPDAELSELRRRDERLAENQWNLYAAAYHFLTRWRDVDLRAGLAGDVETIEELPPVPAAAIEQFIELHGTPPEPFHELARAGRIQELPLVDREGGLYDVLTRRKTTRGYDRDASIGLDELSTVLRYVFGSHGWAPIVGDLYSIKRTSPSGGGLHPVEAYPIVSGVDGLEAGLYHYRGRDHALELVTPLTDADASSLATDFVCGQSYFGSAHVSVILTARYYRSFWKYRKHQKAYAALLMDAAHLSQSLYLVAADLGLGAYVTVAINSAQIDEALGLDPVSEGAIAVCGFGRPSTRQSPFEPVFRPFRPRETQPPDGPSR
jgi:putative peptide maturation dehydrogenase